MQRLIVEVTSIGTDLRAFDPRRSSQWALSDLEKRLTSAIRAFLHPLGITSTSINSASPPTYAHISSHQLDQLKRVLASSNDIYRSVLDGLGPVKRFGYQAWSWDSSHRPLLIDTINTFNARLSHPGPLVDDGSVPDLEARIAGEVSWRVDEMKGSLFAEVQGMVERLEEDRLEGERQAQAEGGYDEDEEAITHGARWNRKWMQSSDDPWSGPYVALDSQIEALNHRIDGAAAESVRNARSACQKAISDAVADTTGECVQKVDAANKIAADAHKRISSLVDRVSAVESRGGAAERETLVQAARKDVRQFAKTGLRVQVERDAREIIMEVVGSVMEEPELAQAAVEARWQKERDGLFEEIKKQKMEAARVRVEHESALANNRKALADLNVQSDTRLAAVRKELQAQKVQLAEAMRVSEQTAVSTKHLRVDLTSVEQSLARTEQQAEAAALPPVPCGEVQGCGAEFGTSAPGRRGGQASQPSQAVLIAEEGKGQGPVNALIANAKRIAIVDISKHQALALDAITERATHRLLAIDAKADKLDTAMLAFEERHSVPPVALTPGVIPSLRDTPRNSSPSASADGVSSTSIASMDDLPGPSRMVKAVKTGRPGMPRRHPVEAAGTRKRVAPVGAVAPMSVSAPAPAMTRSRDGTNQAVKGKDQGAEKEGPRGKKMSRVEAEKELFEGGYITENVYNSDDFAYE